MFFLFRTLKRGDLETEDRPLRSHSHGFFLVSLVRPVTSSFYSNPDQNLVRDTTTIVP